MKKIEKEKEVDELFSTMTEIITEKGYLNGMKDEIREFILYFSKLDVNIDVPHSKLIEYADLRTEIWEERIKISNEFLDKEAKRFKIDEKIS